MSLTHAITALLLLSFAIESIVTALLSAFHPPPRAKPPPQGIAPSRLSGENLTQPANPPDAQASGNDEEKERQEKEWKRKDQLLHLGLRALMAPALAACLVSTGGEKGFLGDVSSFGKVFQWGRLDMFVTALLLMAGSDGIQGLRKQLGASSGAGGKPRGNSPPKPQPEGASLKLRVDPKMLGQALAEAKKALREGENQDDQRGRDAPSG